MDEIPPVEAFDPQPDEPRGASRARRGFRIALTMILVAALVVLAALEGGGYIIRGDRGVDPTPPPAAPRIVVVDSAGVLTSIDRRGAQRLPPPA